MAIFLLILKIIGISLLAIIGLAILILCVPLFVYIRFEEEPTVDVRFLFIKFRVHPSEKNDTEAKDSFFRRIWRRITGKGNTDNKESEEKEKAEESKFKALFGERGAAGAISFLWEILKLAFGRAVKILRGVVVSKFNLRIEIVGDDASDTALRYGKLCGVVYPALSFIFQNVKKYRHEIDMRPNFDSNLEYDQVSLDAKLRICPIKVGFHAAALLLGVLISEIKRQVDENRTAAEMKTN